MSVLRLMILVVVATAAVAGTLWAVDDDPGPIVGDPKVPNTLREISGNRIASYCFFAVLGGLCVLLIRRGIRAR